MKRSTLQKQHATALRGARSCFLEGAPFLRYTLITKLAGVGKLLRYAEPEIIFRRGLSFLSKFSKLIGIKYH